MALDITKYTNLKDNHLKFKAFYNVFGIELDLFYHEDTFVGGEKKDSKEVAIKTIQDFDKILEMLAYNGMDVRGEFKVSTYWSIYDYTEGQFYYRVNEEHHQELINRGMTKASLSRKRPVPVFLDILNVHDFIKGKTADKEKLEKSLNYVLLKDLFYRYLTYQKGTLTLIVSNREVQVDDTYLQGTLFVTSVESLMDILISTHCGVQITAEGQLVLIMTTREIKKAQGVSLDLLHGKLPPTVAHYYTNISLYG